VKVSKLTTRVTLLYVKMTKQVTITS